MEYRAVHVTTSPEGKYRQTVTVGTTHELAADVPAAHGGADAGPEPHEWLLAGLGACTAITLQMYAERKGWKLSKVGVTVKGEHAEGAFIMHRELTLEGELDDEKRARLKEIAEKCPVHKTLTGTIRIETSLAG
jgi:putative redox protein